MEALFPLGVTPTHPPTHANPPFPHPHLPHPTFLFLCFHIPPLACSRIVQYSSCPAHQATNANHPPQAVNAHQRNAVHGMETPARTAGAGLTRDMVTGELGQGNRTAWYRTHDESAKGQRDSRYLQPSRRRQCHGSGESSGDGTTNRQKKRWEQRKTSQPNKLPLTMEVRCTRQLCVRAAG
jgi:hypothetical protein